jgi:hypothetical protein
MNLVEKKSHHYFFPSALFVVAIRPSMVNIRDRLNEDRLVDDLDPIDCESCDPKGQSFERMVQLKGVEKSY